MLAATTMQALGAQAERVAADPGLLGHLAPAVAAGLAGCIAKPEPGYMFPARQGCAARECAAQGLLKLASGRGNPATRSTAVLQRGWVVSPQAHAGQTHATGVSGLVLEAGRRAADSGTNSSGGGATTAAVTEVLAELTGAGPVDAAGFAWAAGEGMYLA
eukprot:SAG22_NODE_3058_length_1976_cov_1.962174_1_plen_160_part_00